MSAPVAAPWSCSDAFADNLSQLSSKWEGELQSVVHTGFLQGKPNAWLPQEVHCQIPATHMKSELWSLWKNFEIECWVAANLWPLQIRDDLFNLDLLILFTFTIPTNCSPWQSSAHRQGHCQVVNWLFFQHKQEHSWCCGNMEETLKLHWVSIPLTFRKLVHIDCYSEYTNYHKQPGNTNLTIRNCGQNPHTTKKDPPLRLCVFWGIQSGRFFGIYGLQLICCKLVIMIGSHFLWMLTNCWAWTTKLTSSV